MDNIKNFCEKRKDELADKQANKNPEQTTNHDHRYKEFWKGKQRILLLFCGTLAARFGKGAIVVFEIIKVLFVIK